MARFHLVQTSIGLALEDRLAPKQQPLRIDFSSSKLKHRRLHGGKKELLLRAVGAKPGLVVSDWTAGLGTDSLLLASAGCTVHMHERSRVMWLLLNDALKIGLEDALDDASLSNELRQTITRMTLHFGDARSQPHNAIDVIYLDPMFAARKKSALVNGPMQYLQKFVGPDLDAETLIQSARETAVTSAVKRVVVKRPADAPKTDATFTLEAKANRFDVYELPGAGCS